MKLERAQKIVESLAKEERNFAYGEWDRDEAICVVLVEMQRKLATAKVDMLALVALGSKTSPTSD